MNGRIQAFRVIPDCGPREVVLRSADKHCGVCRAAG